MGGPLRSSLPFSWRQTPTSNRTTTNNPSAIFGIMLVRLFNRVIPRIQHTTITSRENLTNGAYSSRGWGFAKSSLSGKDIVRKENLTKVTPQIVGLLMKVRYKPTKLYCYRSNWLSENGIGSELWVYNARMGWWSAHHLICKKHLSFSAALILTTKIGHSRISFAYSER